MRLANINDYSESRYALLVSIIEPICADALKVTHDAGFCVLI